MLISWVSRQINHRKREEDVKIDHERIMVMLVMLANTQKAVMPDKKDVEDQDQLARTFNTFQKAKVLVTNQSKQANKQASKQVGSTRKEVTEVKVDTEEREVVEEDHTEEEEDMVADSKAEKDHILKAVNDTKVVVKENVVEDVADMEAMEEDMVDMAALMVVTEDITVVMQLIQSSPRMSSQL